MVNTIPPLSTSRARRGTAPDQNVKIPSCLKIFAAQTKLFLYSFRASIDCILLTFSTRAVIAKGLFGLPCFDGIQRLSCVPGQRQSPMLLNLL